MLHGKFEQYGGLSESNDSSSSFKLFESLDDMAVVIVEVVVVLVVLVVVLCCFVMVFETRHIKMIIKRII